MIYFMGGGFGAKRYIKSSEIKNGYFLETFYVLREPKCEEKFKEMETWSDLIIIDSGAFTFMNSGTNMTVDSMDAYFKEYCEFIRKHKDNPKIIGFFELDVDRVFGVEKAMEYLNKLTTITDKIIPVWHNTRPVSFYYDMCKNYKRVAITQAILSDVYPEQMNLFINCAHKYGANIHLLGFARFDILDKLNLNKEDSFDAVSYIMYGAFYNLRLINDKVTKIFTFDLKGLETLKTDNIISLNAIINHKLQLKLREVDNSVKIS